MAWWMVVEARTVEEETRVARAARVEEGREVVATAVVGPATLLVGTLAVAGWAVGGAVTLCKRQLVSEVAEGVVVLGTTSVVANVLRTFLVA